MERGPWEEGGSEFQKQYQLEEVGQGQTHLYTCMHVSVCVCVCVCVHVWV